MDLHDLLRERTRNAHARLDAALDFGKPGCVTRGRYGALLRATLGVVEVLEPAVDAWLGPRPGPARLTCLHADLAALGEGRQQPLPRVRLPGSEAEAYGCAYVLEGSTLGGLVLASIVSRALGADLPTRYLALRGERTKPMWLHFLATLQAFGRRSDTDAHRRASAIAVDTFAAYEASLRAAGLCAEVA